MKIKSCKLFKIIAILLCFLMIEQQSGFAQVAGQIDIAGHLNSFRNSVILDKFRPLHLRYLQYDNQANNIKVLLDKGNLKTLSNSFVEKSTQSLLKYFFVGVTLPNSTFWVNLRPDSQDQIIDPLLAQTDIGKVLLESDVQLKKDTASFTSPQTPEGKEYWDKLYKKAGELFGSQNVTIPTLTRPWIVPGEIIIRQTNENAYIYKATLKVMLEDDYLKGSAVYNFDDERLKELNSYASDILREKIVPKLTLEINNSKRYAALRQVYYSLILAQWFKERFANKSGLYSNLIDRKNLNGLTSKEPWSKGTYFQQYQKSFKEGEYNFKVPMSTPYGQVIRSYFSGGIDLMQTAPAINAGLALEGSSAQLPLAVARSPNLAALEVVGGNAENPVPEIRMTPQAEASPKNTEVKAPSTTPQSSEQSLAEKIEVRTAGEVGAGNKDSRDNGGRGSVIDLSRDNGGNIDLTRFRVVIGQGAIRLSPADIARVEAKVKGILLHIKQNRPDLIFNWIKNLGFNLSAQGIQKLYLDIRYIASGRMKDALLITITTDTGESREVILVVKSATTEGAPLLDLGELEIYQNSEAQEAGLIPHFGGVAYIEKKQAGLGEIVTEEPADGEEGYEVILIQGFQPGPTVAQLVENGQFTKEIAKRCLITLMKLLFILSKGQTSGFIGSSDFHQNNIVIDTDTQNAVLVDPGEKRNYDSLQEYLFGIIYYYGGERGEALEALYENPAWAGTDWDRVLLRLRTQVMRSIGGGGWTSGPAQINIGGFSVEESDGARILKAITTFLVEQRGYEDDGMGDLRKRVGTVGEFKSFIKALFSNRTRPLAVADIGSGAYAEFENNLLPVLSETGVSVDSSVSVDKGATTETLTDKVKKADVTDEIQRNQVGLTNESRDLVTINNIISADLIPAALRILKAEGVLLVTFAESDLARWHEYSNPQIIDQVKARIEQLAQADPGYSYEVREIGRPADYPVSNSKNRTPYPSHGKMIVVVKHRIPAQTSDAEKNLAWKIHQATQAELGRSENVEDGKDIGLAGSFQDLPERIQGDNLASARKATEILSRLGVSRADLRLALRKAITQLRNNNKLNGLSVNSPTDQFVLDAGTEIHNLWLSRQRQQGQTIEADRDSGFLDLSVQQQLLDLIILQVVLQEEDSGVSQESESAAPDIKSNAEIKLEEATAQEIEAVAAFRQNNFIPELKDKPANLTAEEFISNYGPKIKSGSVNLFVARDNGKIIGYVLVRKTNGNGWIYEVSVDPTYRGRGLGRSLFEKGLNFIKDGQNKVTTVMVTDWSSNGATARIAKGFGFNETDDKDGRFILKTRPERPISIAQSGAPNLAGKINGRFVQVNANGEIIVNTQAIASVLGVSEDNPIVSRVAAVIRAHELAEDAALARGLSIQEAHAEGMMAEADAIGEDDELRQAMHKLWESLGANRGAEAAIEYGGLDAWGSGEVGYEGEGHKFKLIGAARIGGEKNKEFWVDENGQLWIFKENPYANESYRPLGTRIYYRFLRDLLGRAGEAYEMSLPDKDGKVRAGTMEKVLFDKSASGINWAGLSEKEVNQKFRELAIPNFKMQHNQGAVSIPTLTATQIQQVLEEMVVDWLFSNQDSHMANFLIDSNGNIIGIDKEQVFKYFPNDRLDLNYLPNGAAFMPLSYYVLRRLAGEYKLSVELIDGVLKKIESIPDSKLEELIRPFAKEYVAQHPDRFKTPEDFIKAFIQRKHNLRRDFQEFFKKVSLENIGIKEIEGFIKKQGFNFTAKSFEPTISEKSFTNLVTPSFNKEFFAKLIQPVVSFVRTIFNPQAELNRRLTEMYGIPKELLKRIQDAQGNPEAIVSIIEEHFNELAQRLEPQERERLERTKENLIESIRAPPDYKTKRLKAILRLLTSWISILKQQKIDYHRMYLARDGGFFHLVDKALGDLEESPSGYDAGSSVYHLSRARMSGESSQYVYRQMQIIIGKAVAVTPKDDIAQLYKNIRKEFRKAIETDPVLKKMVVAIKEELLALGYDTKDKIVIVDTGFLGTIPLFIKNILEMDKEESDLVDESGQERIQIAIIQPSSISAFANALLGFDVNMFTGEERGIVERLAAELGSAKSVGSHLEAIEEHPIEFNEDNWSIEEVGASAKLKVFFEQILAAQMVIAFHDRLGAGEELPVEFKNILNTIAMKTDFIDLVKNSTYEYTTISEKEILALTDYTKPENNIIFDAKAEYIKIEEQSFIKYSRFKIISFLIATLPLSLLPGILSSLNPIIDLPLILAVLIAGLLEKAKANIINAAVGVKNLIKGKWNALLGKNNVSSIGKRVPIESLIEQSDIEFGPDLGYAVRSGRIEIGDLAIEVRQASDAWFKENGIKGNGVVLLHNGSLMIVLRQDIGIGEKRKALLHEFIAVLSLSGGTSQAQETALIHHMADGKGLAPVSEKSREVFEQANKGLVQLSLFEALVVATEEPESEGEGVNGINYTQTVARASNEAIANRIKELSRWHIGYSSKAETLVIANRLKINLMLSDRKLSDLTFKDLRPYFELNDFGQAMGSFIRLVATIIVGTMLWRGLIQPNLSKIKSFSRNAIERVLSIEGVKAVSEMWDTIKSSASPGNPEFIERQRQEREELKKLGVDITIKYVPANSPEGREELQALRKEGIDPTIKYVPANSPEGQKALREYREMGVFGGTNFEGAPGQVTISNLDALGAPADAVIAAYNQGALRTLNIRALDNGEATITAGIVTINGRQIRISINNNQDAPYATVNANNEVEINVDKINNLLRNSNLSSEERRAALERILIHDITEAYALESGLNAAESHTSAMMAEAMHPANSQNIRNALSEVLKERDLRQAEQLRDGLGYGGDNVLSAVVSQPLADPRIIAPNDIGNILVYAPHKKLGEAKLGETVIDTWTFVPALLKKFPNAKIYVMTDYPEIFKSAYFKGRVIPLAVEEGWGKTKFIADHPIDMVVDLNILSGKFRNIDPADCFSGKPPHVIEIISPASIFKAGSPTFLSDGFHVNYTDRQGNRFTVKGDREILDEIAPRGVVKERGIWELVQKTCSILGLSPKIEHLKPTGEELSSAISILKSWYDANNPNVPFDPRKKVFIVNVYAITHPNIIKEEVWIEIIRELLKLDAYIIFTSGSPSERNDSAERLINKVGDIENKNKIILPKKALYPVINNILGITSWVLTIDTGLSHLSNGVYGVPTSVLTEKEILHWLVPGDNAYPVVVNRLTGSLRERVLGFDTSDIINSPNFKRIEQEEDLAVISDIVNKAREIVQAKEDSVVFTAKLASLSTSSRNKLDSQLLAASKLNYPSVREDLEAYLTKSIKEAGVRLSVLPEVVFVDTLNQEDLAYPRFKVKLHKEGNKLFLLIDRSVLDTDAQGVVTLTPEAREGILHEIFGHLLIRDTYPEFEENNVKALQGEVDSHSVLYMKTLEEVLSRIVSNYFASKLAGQDVSRYDFYNQAKLAAEQILKENMLEMFRYKDVLRDNKKKEEIIILAADRASKLEENLKSSLKGSAVDSRLRSGLKKDNPPRILIEFMRNSRAQRDEWYTWSAEIDDSQIDPFFRKVAELGNEEVVFYGGGSDLVQMLLGESKVILAGDLAEVNVLKGQSEYRDLTLSMGFYDGVDIESWVSMQGRRRPAIEGITIMTNAESSIDLNDYINNYEADLHLVTGHPEINVPLKHTAVIVVPLRGRARIYFRTRQDYQNYLDRVMTLPDVKRFRDNPASLEEWINENRAHIQGVIDYCAVLYTRVKTEKSGWRFDADSLWEIREISKHLTPQEKADIRKDVLDKKARAFGSEEDFVKAIDEVLAEFFGEETGVNRVEQKPKFKFIESRGMLSGYNVWGIEDGNGVRWWLKPKSAKEVFVYRLAALAGMNMPEHKVVRLSDLEVTGLPPRIESQWADEANSERLFVRDAGKEGKLSLENLAQKESSGLEELIAMFVWINAGDVDINHNLSITDIAGLNRYIVYDVEMSPYYPGIVDEGIRKLFKDLIRNAGGFLDTTRLNQAIARIEALDAGLILKLAKETGNNQVEAERLVDGLIARKNSLRQLLADSLREANKNNPVDSIEKAAGSVFTSSASVSEPGTRMAIFNQALEEANRQFAANNEVDMVALIAKYGLTTEEATKIAIAVMPSQGGGLGAAEAEFDFAAKRIWELWNMTGEANLELEIMNLTEHGYIVARGNQNDLFSALADKLLREIPADKKGKAVEVIGRLAENVRQHGGDRGILIARIYSGVLYIAMIDLGEGFSWENMDAIAEGKVVQREGSPGKGVSLGVIMQNADNVRIYSRGYQVSLGSQKRQRVESISRLKGSLITADINLLKGTPSIPKGAEGFASNSTRPADQAVNGSQPLKKGGIDLRALPIVTQTMNINAIKPISTQGQVLIPNAKLDQEWNQIETMLNAGIIPSLERIKEYIASSCKSTDCQERIDRALSGVADILRIEEERSSLTEAALKQLLVLLESNKGVSEMELALVNIDVSSKEPVLIN